MHCIVRATTLLGCESSGGRGLAGVALLGQEGSGDGINYDNKDGGQCHTRGGADNDDKQQERSLNHAR